MAGLERSPESSGRSSSAVRRGGILLGVLVRAQRETVAETSHRPWPLPDRPWLMAQTWENLLFAHWPVPVETLRRVVPSPLPVDTFAGTAWIGVTPFLIRGQRLRLAPPLPLLSRFPELNVRTYVTFGGRPGIYFLSLDAASRLAVLGARRAFRLPYFRARMSARGSGGGVRYSSTRASPDGERADFLAVYRSQGPCFRAEPGSLEYFLAERYCLFTLDEGLRVHRADIHHPPWPLQSAEAQIEHNTMARPLGIELGDEPLLHFAGRQHVLIWRRCPDAG